MKFEGLQSNKSKDKYEAEDNSPEDSTELIPLSGHIESGSSNMNRSNIERVARNQIASRIIPICIVLMFTFALAMSGLAMGVYSYYDTVHLHTEVEEVEHSTFKINKKQTDLKTALDLLNATFQGLELDIISAIDDNVTITLLQLIDLANNTINTINNLANAANITLITAEEIIFNATEIANETGLILLEAEMYANNSHYYSLLSQSYYNSTYILYILVNDSLHVIDLLVVNCTQCELAALNYSLTAKHYWELIYNESILIQIYVNEANASAIAAETAELEAEAFANSANVTLIEIELLKDEMEALFSQFNATIENIIDSGLLNGNLTNSTATLIFEAIQAVNETLEIKDEIIGYLNQIIAIALEIDIDLNQTIAYEEMSCLCRNESCACAQNCSVNANNTYVYMLEAEDAANNSLIYAEECRIFANDSMIFAGECNESVILCAMYANDSYVYSQLSFLYAQSAANIAALLGMDTNGTFIYGSIRINGTTRQIEFLQTHITYIQVTDPSQDITITLIDPGVDSKFVLTESAQTINGVITFSTPFKLTSLSAKSVLILDATKAVSAVTLADGQILIGSTGNLPAAATITGTSNQITVTNGANTITLSLPQDIATSSSPSFSAITLSGLTAKSILTLNAAGLAVGVGLTNGQLLIGSTGNSPVAAALTGTTNQITVTPGAGTITLSTPQSIATTSSPTFASLSLSNMVANGVVTTDGSDVLKTTSLTNGQLMVGSTSAAPVATTLTGTSNQVIVTNGAGSITLSLPQNIGVTNSPQFKNLALTSGTPPTITLSSTTDSSSYTLTIPAGASVTRTYTVPDSGTPTSAVILADGTQTINGDTTFAGAVFHTALTAKGILTLGSSKQVVSTALTNGQLMIGSTGNSPSAATLTGTSNQITVTNGAGTITLATPQDIATSSSPTFGGLTVSTAGVVATVQSTDFHDPILTISNNFYGYSYSIQPFDHTAVSMTLYIRNTGTATSDLVTTDGAKTFNNLMTFGAGISMPHTFTVGATSSTSSITTGQMEKFASGFANFNTFGTTSTFGAPVTAYKLGKIVTLFFDDITFTVTTPSSFCCNAGAIPSIYRPAPAQDAHSPAYIEFIIGIVTGGNNGVGRFGVLADGSFCFRGGTTVSTFNFANGAGEWFGFSVTYPGN